MSDSAVVEVEMDPAPGYDAREDLAGREINDGHVQLPMGPDDTNASPRIESCVDLCEWVRDYHPIRCLCITGIVLFVIGVIITIAVTNNGGGGDNPVGPPNSTLNGSMELLRIRDVPPMHMETFTLLHVPSDSRYVFYANETHAHVSIFSRTGELEAVIHTHAGARDLIVHIPEVSNCKAVLGAGDLLDWVHNSSVDDELALVGFKVDAQPELVFMTETPIPPCSVVSANYSTDSNDDAPKFELLVGTKHEVVGDVFRSLRNKYGDAVGEAVEETLASKIDFMVYDLTSAKFVTTATSDPRLVAGNADVFVSQMQAAHNWPTPLGAQFAACNQHSKSPPSHCSASRACSCVHAVVTRITLPETSPCGACTGGDKSGCDCWLQCGLIKQMLRALPCVQPAECYVRDLIVPCHADPEGCTIDVAQQCDTCFRFAETTLQHQKDD
jgi:hypothetical protein